MRLKAKTADHDPCGDELVDDRDAPVLHDFRRLAAHQVHVRAHGLGVFCVLSEGLATVFALLSELLGELATGSKVNG